MAIITVRRAQAFKRGNASIQILLDGKASGVILTDEVLNISTSGGSHTLHASMHGMKGPKLNFELGGTESLDLTISGLTIPKYQWWETFLFLVILILPGRLGIDRYFWLIIALYSVAMISLIISTRSRMRKMLNIERAETSGMANTSVPAG